MEKEIETEVVRIPLSIIEKAERYRKRYKGPSGLEATTKSNWISFLILKGIEKLELDQLVDKE